jgi:hypothetical protein
MIATVGAMALVSLLVAGALAATRGDLRLTQRDLDKKRAYAAAQAGIADYSFHLNQDNNYWAKCTSVPTPNAVNQQGSTAKKRFVPGSTDASYAIELLPATGQTSCSTSNPVGTMLEQGAVNTGSFRIRSTGFVANTKASIVATFRRASLLDYIYFTQLETSDPITYGYPNPSTALTGANTQCSKFRREGRESAPIPGTGGSDYCNRIVFVSGDDINGPLHTNDDLLIKGSPAFGRTAADVIEVSAGPPGWFYCNCGGGASPQFVGPLVTTAPVLTPPPTNGKLKTAAGSSYTYFGQTSIVLSGGNMSINGGSSVPIPAEGVVYVANSLSTPCSTSYSPYTATYPSSSGCGNALVSGTYSGQLTIAAENDVVVQGNVTRSGNGLLGLVANNFVRIKHPFSDTNDTVSGQCDGGSNQTGTLTNARVDAAILAIQHSFIVDHYDCGASLGTLTVNGAIAQKYRGPVGTTGGTGYLKSYNYDDRLRYQEPPHFLDPVESAWHIQRETLDFP